MSDERKYFIDEILIISLKSFPCVVSPLYASKVNENLSNSKIAAIVTMTTVSLYGLAAERQIRRVIENMN